MRITAAELDRRKSRIIHTAYELFCEDGIDAVLMDKIAQKSAVSLNSVFRYFESKAKLVQMTQQHLWDELVEQILSQCREQQAAATNGLEEMKVLLTNFRGLYLEHSNYLLFSNEYRLFLARRKISISEQDYHSTLKPVYVVFIAALERGRADGSISCRDAVEDQFFTVWSIMRSFTGEMALMGRMCEGENLWLKQFDRVLHDVLDGLKAE